MLRKSWDTVLGERGDIKSISQKRHWIFTLPHLNLFFPFWTAASENDTTHCFWPICKCNLNMQKLFLKFKSVVDIFSVNSGCISLTNVTACYLNSLVSWKKQAVSSCLATSRTRMQKESNFCVSMKPHDENCQWHQHTTYTCANTQIDKERYLAVQLISWTGREGVKRAPVKVFLPSLVLVISGSEMMSWETSTASSVIALHVHLQSMDIIFTTESISHYSLTVHYSKYF